MKIEINDIVQLHPHLTENKGFSACLMIVTEVKPWGIQGYVQALGDRENSGGLAYYRAKNGSFEKTGGKAVWAVE